MTEIRHAKFNLMHFAACEDTKTQAAILYLYQLCGKAEKK